MFNKDIVLDQEAISNAVSDFAALGQRLAGLRKEIEAMLSLVEKGFNTPAGKKFVQSCRTNLLAPMDDQKLVLEHISQTLRDCRDRYATVFDEYEQLNKKISQIQEM